MADDECINKQRGTAQEQRTQYDDRKEQEVGAAQVCRKAERDRNSPAAGAGGAAPESAGAGTIAVAASWSFAMISRVLLISCYVKIFKFFNMRVFL